MSGDGGANSSGERLQVNSSDVVHELVDDEVVAINLSRGSYYSLGGGAADAWAMLVNGTSGEQIASAFSGAPGDTQLEEEVAALLEKLRTETLVVPAEETGGNGATPPPTLEYRPFTFEKYEDLQDYFLLDPIHEVGEAGWPAPKPG